MCILIKEQSTYWRFICRARQKDILLFVFIFIIWMHFIWFHKFAKEILNSWYLQYDFLSFNPQEDKMQWHLLHFFLDEAGSPSRGFPHPICQTSKRQTVVNLITTTSCVCGPNYEGGRETAINAPEACNCKSNRQQQEAGSSRRSR